LRALLASPRRRRRLAWLGGTLVACLVAALVVALVPHTSGEIDRNFSNEPVQRVIPERNVPVTPARRAEVNVLFDAFVPAAVERRDPSAAYDLVTPAFRGGVDRSVWDHGDLPVYPYEPHGKVFHGWTVDTSYRTSMSVQLFLQPRDPKDGPVAYSVDLKRLRGRWLIDSFYPRAAYAPTASATGSKTGAKTGVAAAPPAERRAHGGVMWILILVFVALVVLTPVVLLAGPSFRDRLARGRVDL
jgi:hypothetical protein